MSHRGSPSLCLWRASCCCQEAAGLCTQTGEWARATGGGRVHGEPGARSPPPRGWSRSPWEPPGERPRPGDLPGLRCPALRSAAWHGFLFAGRRRLRLMAAGVSRRWQEEAVALAATGAERRTPSVRGCHRTLACSGPVWTAPISLPGAGAPGQPGSPEGSLSPRPASCQQQGAVGAGGGAAPSDPSPNPIPTLGGGQRAEGRGGQWGGAPCSSTPRARDPARPVHPGVLIRLRSYLDRGSCLVMKLETSALLTWFLPLSGFLLPDWPGSRSKQRAHTGAGVRARSSWPGRPPPTARLHLPSRNAGRPACGLSVCIPSGPALEAVA